MLIIWKSSRRRWTVTGEDKRVIDNTRNNRKTGSEFEQVAADELVRKGYRILERNYRCPKGEIDIIAEDEGTICFVEVKYRINNSKGFPEDAVSYQKQRVISKVAEYYLTTRIHRLDVPCRFDVIGVLDGELKHYENAFDYIG